MTSADLSILTPLIILAGGAVLILPVIAIRRSHVLTAAITLISLALAFFTLLQDEGSLPYAISPLFIIDRFAVYFMGLVIAAGFLLTVLSFDYLKRSLIQREEYYVLLLLAILGSSVLIISRHFVSFFLGLEILGVSLYTLIAYMPEQERGAEAGIKYLILAASASAFLLFGMALVYFETGTMRFNALAAGHPGIIMYAGLGLMIVGIGFKLAVVPFHMWTADVYEGAPAPVTAFIATVSKGSVFALILRLFLSVDIYKHKAIYLVFVIIAVASMFTGNLLALMQENIKRILAYSSIAHLGYLLVAFLAGEAMGIAAVAFYLAAYFVTIIGAFAIIAALPAKNGEAMALEDYRGLYWRHPWMAAILTAMMLSLAGIPLTAGFIAKFYVLVAGIKAALWFLVFVLVINSAIGVYYYLRVIMTMFSKSGEPATASQTVSPISGIVLTVLAIILIWVGVAPGPLIDAIHTFVTNLFAVASQSTALFP